MVNNNMLGNEERVSTRQTLAGTTRGAPGFTMMMTNERKIWEAAMLLVRRHGGEAVAIAEREAERLRDGDALTCVVWCWIARSTAELVRPVPGAGERVQIGRAHV